MNLGNMKDLIKDSTENVKEKVVNTGESIKKKIEESQSKKYKYKVEPVRVKNKEELATAVLQNSKVIYVVGRYYYDVKQQIKKSTVTYTDTEKYKKEKEEFEQRLNNEPIHPKTGADSLFNVLSNLLILPVKLLALPLEFIAEIFKLNDDIIQSKLKEYKLKNNKKRGRMELYKIKGEGCFNPKYDYVEEQNEIEMKS